MYDVCRGQVTMHILGSSLPGAAGNFTQTPPTAGHTKRGLGSWVKNSLEDLNKVHKTINGSAPLNAAKNHPLFDKSIDCPQNGAVPAFSGSAKVDLNGKVTGNTNYGVVVAGRLLPPKVDEFGIFVNLDATVTGTVGIEASLTVSTTLADDVRSAKTQAGYDRHWEHPLV